MACIRDPLGIRVPAVTPRATAESCFFRQIDVVRFLWPLEAIVVVGITRATSGHTRLLGKWLSVSRCLVIGPEPLVQYP